MFERIRSAVQRNEIENEARGDEPFELARQYLLGHIDDCGHDRVRKISSDDGCDLRDLTRGT